MDSQLCYFLEKESPAPTLRQRCRGSQRYSVILSTRMQPMVRTASARISGLGSCESCAHARARGRALFTEAVMGMNFEAGAAQSTCRRH